MGVKKRSIRTVMGGAGLSSGPKEVEGEKEGDREGRGSHKRGKGKSRN